MTAPDFPGEFLLSAASPNPLVTLSGPTWSGIEPAPIDVPVPNQTSLVGLSFFAQGLMVDPMSPFGAVIALTSALELVVGP